MQANSKAAVRAAVIVCGLLATTPGVAQTLTNAPSVEVQKDQHGRHTAQFAKRVPVLGHENCGEGRQIKLTRQKDSKTQKEIDRPGDVPLMQLAASTGKVLVVNDAKCVNGVVEGTGVSLEPAPQPAPDCKQPLRRGTSGCP